MGSSKGFTLIELLVVIGIISMLVSLLVMGVGAATRRAQMANTRFLMSSLVQATVRFKADHGYYPPVLGAPSDLLKFGQPTLGWTTQNSRPTPAPTSTAPSIGFMRDMLMPPSNGIDDPTKVGLKVPQWTESTASTIGRSRPQSSEAQALQQWHSITSPAEYLVGSGDRSADGYGICGNLPDVMPDDLKPGQREIPREGIRSPGIDGVWGAALTPITVPEVKTTPGYTAGPKASDKFVGQFYSRNLAPPTPIEAGTEEPGDDDKNCLVRCQPNLRGKVYGPYLELKDPSNFGGIKGVRPAPPSQDEPDTEELDIVRATDGDPMFDNYPKCIIDYWGNPIRYYRRGYTSFMPSSPDATNDGTKFDLADFFALRPSRAEESEFILKDEAKNQVLADADGDRSGTIRLRSAEFAYFSAGPDGKRDLRRRITLRGPRSDINVNEDNLVETGP